MTLKEYETEMKRVVWLDNKAKELLTEALANKVEEAQLSGMGAAALRELIARAGI